MTALLLDTNVVVWLLTDTRDAISKAALEALEDEENVLSVSAASVWEIAIKRSLNKLEIDPRWPRRLSELDVEFVPVTLEHAARVEHLPWHHRDPFDRLLIAQALVEGRVVVTADGRFGGYDVEVLW